MQGQGRTDIEWNTGEGIEVGDKVRFSDNWYIAFLGYVPEKITEYEVLAGTLKYPNPFTAVTIGAYGRAGTKTMFEHLTQLKNLTLVSKGHKPLKDLGPLV